MRVLVVTNMYPTPNNPAFGTFVEEQVDSLRKKQIDVDVFAFEGRRNAIKYLKAVFGFRRALSRKHYDLVHAHYGLSGFVARMQTRCPVVVTFHGQDLMLPRDVKGRHLIRHLLATVIGKLVALATAERIVVADMLKSKLWFRSAVTIPMGVDLALFKPMSPCKARRQLGIPDNTKKVLFVGDPTNPLKGFLLAEKAVQLLQREGWLMELLPLYNVLHRKVPLYMNACDALLFTSKQEASPCVIKEAMACNLPIVSTNVGDVAERINGVFGCYICQPEPQDVALKLRLVLSRDRESNGREKIQDLNLENVAQRVIEVYQRILATKGSASEKKLAVRVQKSCQQGDRVKN